MEEVKRALELEGPRVRRTMEMGLGHWKWAQDIGYTNRALELEGPRVRKALEVGLGFGIRRAQDEKGGDDDDHNNNNNNNKVLK